MQFRLAARAREASPVSKQNSGRLKLFGEPQPRAAAADNPLANHALVEAFATATGWRIAPGAPATKTNLTSSAPDNPGVGASPGHSRIVLQPVTGAAHRIPRAAAESLAAEMAALLEQFGAVGSALREREAELASHVPVAARRDELSLGVRLERLLQSAASAADCQAAALYLLDDATTELKLRAGWNLPLDRYLAPARPLRDATADLEALLGHAVVLSEPELYRLWNAPESFPAAACVPVSSARTQLGTLWTFAESKRDFSDAQTNMLEIAAGRIAAELEREVLLAELLDARGQISTDEPRSSRPAIVCPTISPVLEGWDIAGCLVNARNQTNAFYDWFELADRSLGTILGCTNTRGPAGIATAAALRAAARVHAGQQVSPGTLLTRLNAVLWSGAGGFGEADVLSVQVTPRSGEAHIASGGSMLAALIRNHNIEDIRFDAKPLGSSDELCIGATTLRLVRGDMLVALACNPSPSGLRRAQSSRIGQGEGSSSSGLGSCRELERMLREPGTSNLRATGFAQLITRLCDKSTNPIALKPCAVVVIRRTG